MSSAEVGSHTRAALPERFDGEWWLPEAPDHRVAGLLDTADSDSWRLDLLGALVGETDDAPGRTILGECRATQITIADAFQTNLTTRWSGELHNSRESFTAFTVLVGEHLTDGAQARFSEWIVETANLADWVTPARLDHSYGEGGAETITLQVPRERLLVTTDTLTILLQWPSGFHMSDRRWSIWTEPSLLIKTTEPLSLVDFRTSVLQPIEHALTLCTGAPEAVERLSIRLPPLSGEQPRGDVQVLERWRGRHSSSRARGSRWSQLITYDDVLDDINGFFSTWLTLHSKHSRAMLEFFADEAESNSYLEDQFLRIVRTLEAWHRSHNPDAVVIDPSVFSEALEAVQSIVSGTDGADRLLGSLKHANSPSLKQRLSELIASADVIGPLITKAPGLVRKIVDRRNDISHQNNPNLKFDDTQLYWANRMLRLLLVEQLLAELGFSANQRREMFSRGGDLRAITGRYNVLLPAPPEKPRGDRTAREKTVTFPVIDLTGGPRDSAP